MVEIESSMSIENLNGNRIAGATLKIRTGDHGQMILTVHKLGAKSGDKSEIRIAVNGNGLVTAVSAAAMAAVHASGSTR